MNCTSGQFHHYTFTFRDDYREYQDHMDPPKEQATLDSSKFPPKGAAFPALRFLVSL